MSVWYVYVDWTREATPRPFYVGMGDERSLRVTWRNVHHDRISRKYGSRREIVGTFETRQAALDREIELIAEFRTRGDREDHWGANYTDGGDGVSGHHHSEETRQKRSESLKRYFARRRGEV